LTDDANNKKKKKNPLDQMITPRTWDFWELLGQFKMVGLKVGMLRKKSLVIPFELRYKKIKIGKLISETAKINGNLKLWYSEDKTRILFYRKVDPEELAQVKKDLSGKDKDALIEAIWKSGWLAQPELVLSLLNAVKSKNKSQSREALKSIKRIGLPAFSIYLRAKAFIVLDKTIKENNYKIRMSSVKALESIGGEKALLIIKKVSRDGSGGVRIAAIESLGYIGGEQALDCIEEALDDNYKWVRYSAINALGRIGGEKAFALIVASLKHKDISIRFRAMYALERIGGAKAFAVIKKIVENKDNPKYRMAVGALGGFGSKDAIALLTIALQDKRIRVRIAAAGALGSLEGDKSLNLIKIALKDGAGIRLRAVRALGRIGGENIHVLLEKPLEDKEWRFVRQAAVVVLGNIGGKKSFILLKKALVDKDSYVREAAVEALGSIRDEKVFTYIKKALEDEDTGVRHSAVMALENKSEKNSLVLLSIAIEDEEDYVRHIAASSIKKIGGKKATVLLGKSLSDINLDIRNIAFEYFSEQKTKLAVSILEKHLRFKDRNIRGQSILALINLGTIDAVRVLGQAFDYLDKDERLILIIAFEKMEARLGTIALLEGMKSKKLRKESRILILKALGNLKQESAIQTLKITLKHKDPDLRCYTLQAIGKIGGKEMHSLLDDGLLDKEASVRESALDAFNAYKDTKTRDILLNHYQRESEKSLRKKTLEILRANFPDDAKVKEILK